MHLSKIISEKKLHPDLWRHTDLSGLAALGFTPAQPASIAPAALPDIDGTAPAHRLVFINGLFAPDLSTQGMLRDALAQTGRDGDYQLSLKDQTCLALDPLELLFLTLKDASPRESHTRLALALGESARLSLLERHISCGTGAAQAQGFDCAIHLGPHAKLLHTKIQDMDKGDYHLSRRTAQLESHALYHATTIIKGALLTRDEITVTLAGPDAQAQIDGLMLQKDRQHADALVQIDHAAPSCSSRQLYKALLDNAAEGVFQGRILVREGAQKTDGHQLCRALLLSESAIMSTRPDLEIAADDVKCSHGATMGSLDEDALFYLRTRGIPEAQARGLLMKAFAEEITQSIPFPEAQRAADALVQQWMEDECP